MMFDMIRFVSVWLPLFTLTSSLCIAQGEAVSMQAEDAHEVFRLLKEECAGDHSCMINAGRDFIKSADCSRYEVGFCIMFQREPHLQRTLVESDTADCGISFWPYHFLRGNWMYQAGRFMEAFDEYVAAEQEGMEPFVTTFTNMGATYFALEEWEAALACFEEAWDLRAAGDAPNAYMILNNIAAINLRFRNYDEALLWVEEAKTNFEELSGVGYGLSQEDLSGARLAIDMNEWFARGALQDTMFVQENWRNLNWGALEAQPKDWMKLIALISPLITDGEFWSAQSRTIVSVLSDLDTDETEWGKTYGPYSLLIDFNRYFPEEHENLIVLWQEIAKLKWRQLPEASDLSQGDGQQEIVLVPVFIGLNAFLLLVWLFLEFRIGKNKRMRVRSARQLLQRLVKIATERKGWGEAGPLLDALVAQFPNTLDAQSAIEAFNLTSSEVEVLISAQLRESPKDLARRKSWTPKYVYTLRSSVRRKLGVEADMPLEEWFNKSQK